MTVSQSVSNPSAKALVRGSTLALMSSAALITGCHSPGVPPTAVAKSPIGPEAFFPDILPDPYEPLNRGVFAVNKALLLGVFAPSARLYHGVVPQPVRRSIRNFTRNITYPGRVTNHLLQARWQGAGDESLRFLTNTTAGVGGLFDVASAWKMPKSDARFAQTFIHWGWQPQRYLMLPLLGPSDETHLAGYVADELATVWNYERPYTYAAYLSAFDRVSDEAGSASQFVRSESDPYVGLKYLWTYASKEQEPEWKVAKAYDLPTLETLGVATIRTDDLKFIDQAREMKVRLSATGHTMKFSYWLQSGNAPLVYIAPGLGTHRLSLPTLSLAETLYQSGFSVVTTSGLFHPEFMQSASTSKIPAYPPSDCQDLLVALSDCDRALVKKFPTAFGKRALVGFSMGGFEAMLLAAREKIQAPELLHFSRYVAVNPPVDLHYGVSVIDSFRDAPLAWPAATRQASINNSIHKVAKISSTPATLRGLPLFDATESKFLIGSSFELTLRDTIYDSQKRHNLGLLNTPISPWSREESYREISTFTFRDYFLRMVIPYYQTRGIGLQDFARETNMRTYEKNLRAMKEVRVITNQNDFLLQPSDVTWLKSTLGSSRVTLFPNGGHLGNLASTEMQTAIVRALDHLE